MTKRYHSAIRFSTVQGRRIEGEFSGGQVTGKRRHPAALGGGPEDRADEVGGRASGGSAPGGELRSRGAGDAAPADVRAGAGGGGPERPFGAAARPGAAGGGGPGCRAGEPVEAVQDGAARRPRRGARHPPGAVCQATSKLQGQTTLKPEPSGSRPVPTGAHKVHGESLQFQCRLTLQFQCRLTRPDRAGHCARPSRVAGVCGRATGPFPAVRCRRPQW